MPLISRAVEVSTRSRSAANPWRTVWLALSIALVCRAWTFGEDPLLSDNADIIPGSYVETHWLDDLPVEQRPEKQRWQPTDSPKLRFRGRIDSDFNWASQSEKNEQLFGQLADSDGLRRARIGIEGEWTSNSRYLAEIDLANGEVVLRDVHIGLGQVREQGEFRVGHFREPFSLEGGTSANSFALMERSSINQLDPARNWGVGYYRCTPDENATFAIGVFHAGSDSSDFQNGPGSNTAITTRATMLPWYESDGRQLMHLGLAGSIRIPDDGLVVISQGPRSPLLDFADSSTSPFVPRLRIPAHSQQLLNAQWALVNGPFSMQAEWYGSLINQVDGGHVFYHGSYLQTGYFLTGDHRSYHRESGTFGAVSVSRPVLPKLSLHSQHAPRGAGAWELTARMGYLDFYDMDTPRGPLGQLVGVRLPQATFGVNWYLADRLRILLNYSLAVPDEPNAGSSTASVLSSRLALFW
ncbi:MAG: porin [Planctomycetaceae bacterium]|nr:porin [Planctomycetaceae bacterium]